MTSIATIAQRASGVTASAADEAVRGETFFSATCIAAPPRPALTQDLDVDVCVIGGGLAGLTTARELARRGWSVAVLEKRRIAWNASGRNTGFVLPGFGQSADRIVERVGADHARALWTLSQAGVDYVRQSIAGGDMSGIEPSDGWLHVSKLDRPDAIADDADLLRSLGADIEVWPANLVRSKLKSDSYFQAIHYPTALNIHPLNYALGLAQLAEDAGARIFEETAALSIDPAGVRKRVVTPSGRIRAARIVLAGNVHLDTVMPELSETLIPVHTFVIVTKPLGASLADAIDYPGSVSDTDRADNHYRIVGGDRLMWAGRMTVWDAQPRAFGRKLRRDLRRRFPQLAAEIDYAWTGALGFTVHRMPQIGEVAPGMWLASGFGGHGLNTTAMAGNLIARALADGDDRWRLFQPFELVWAGGRAGRVVLQAAYWGHRKYEKWASRLARRKETRRIRNGPRLAEEAERAKERARLRVEKEPVAEIARLENERRAAEKAEVRRIERERIAAEKAETRRIKAEQRAVERAEAARLKAEQHAARLAEADRLAAEMAETRRIEAERLAAEEADAARARQDAEAAQERARWEAVVEAERIEAERVAAETFAEPVARSPDPEGSAEQASATIGGSSNMPADDQPHDNADSKRSRRSRRFNRR